MVWFRWEPWVVVSVVLPHNRFSLQENLQSGHLHSLPCLHGCTFRLLAFLLHFLLGPFSFRSTMTAYVQRGCPWCAISEIRSIDS